jgi:hypothetical protein
VDYESHAVALDRNELGALLVAAGLGPPAGHALISLLALNGLRVSEATAADIEHLGLERGHRTLTITRKGGKIVTVPLAPRAARAIDLAIGERTEGPVFLAANGRRLDRHGAGRIVHKTARCAGISKAVTRTHSGMFSLLSFCVAIAAIGGQADLRPALLDYLFLAAACCGTCETGQPPSSAGQLRHEYHRTRRVREEAMRSSPLRSMPGFPCATSKRLPRMLTRGPRCAMTGLGAAWTGTPPISSPRISRAPPGSPRPGWQFRLAATAAGRNWCIIRFR